jgi:hypothetical protein
MIGASRGMAEYATLLRPARAGLAQVNFRASSA